MARKREPIKTRSFVRIDGELREVKDLPREVWEPIAKDLLCRYLNELYRGRAHFSYPEDDKNTNTKGGKTHESTDRIVLSCGG